MGTYTTDKETLRELARKYMDVCHRPAQEVRRETWRRHNSLIRTMPPIYVRAFAWHEMPESRCTCDDPILRQIEASLRHSLQWDTFGDDSIFEPWVTVAATKRSSGWGVSGEHIHSADPRGSFKIDYPIKSLSDTDKLHVPRHEIDEDATAARVARVQDAVGDIITVNVDRGPAYRMWGGDISTDLGYLRGIENIMVDMYDNPEWLHQLCRFMSDGIMKAQDEAEKAGDWGLCAHQNQAMPYSTELRDPAPNVNGVKRGELWGYMAAQEFTGISPAMHEEFLLRYQLPILKKFGLTAYGCCEDLTHKMDMLRQIPNLRRIAVSPFADAARCAEQVGTDYVLSYRPSPADMVSYGYNPERIASILRRDLAACRGCHVDVTLKDVETVQGDPDRVRKWVQLTRSILAELFG